MLLGFAKPCLSGRDNFLSGFFDASKVAFCVAPAPYTAVSLPLRSSLQLTLATAVLMVAATWMTVVILELVHASTPVFATEQAAHRSPSASSLILYSWPIQPVQQSRSSKMPEHPHPGQQSIHPQRPNHTVPGSPSTGVKPSAPLAI